MKTAWGECIHGIPIGLQANQGIFGCVHSGHDSYPSKGFQQSTGELKKTWIKRNPQNESNKPRKSARMIQCKQDCIFPRKLRLDIFRPQNHSHES